MPSISLGYNNVPPSAKKDILEVFESGQYSPGPKVREFERAFARAHRAKHAVFVNSGTDALRLSLLALKEKFAWKDGDLVAVPALTFVATVNVILQAGLSPFFVDVGHTDYLLNPWNLRRRVNEEPPKNLVAILPVHLFGGRLEEEVYDLARDYDLKVLEDSCETILNPLRGEVSCYSTYMAHHVTTGVGGLALTNDDEIHLLIRSLANHGRNAEYLPGYKETLDLTKRFSFERLGYSSRSTEFAAVLGLSQLDGLKENVTQRRAVARKLFEVFRRDMGIVPPFITPEHTCLMFPLVISEDSKIDKYDLCRHLEKSGIETRDMMPVTNQPCYRHLLKESDFPVARWINKNGFYIPCHPGVTEEDIETIRDAFMSYGRKRSCPKNPKAPKSKGLGVPAIAA